MLHERSVGTKEFLEFLKRLMVNAKKQVFLVVDGHPAHKAKMVKSHVDGLNAKLKLFYLTPYSPHLNPDETVRAHEKWRLSCQLVRSTKAMKRLALGALRSIQKQPEQLRSFFRHPDCRYIL